MGRYYDGDINGKFMFAVQSSAAADRFGSEGHNNYLEYYFDDEHLPTIEEELALLKEDFEKVEEFFKDRNSWTDEIAEAAGISREMMSNYADYHLGKQIFDCVKENGQCLFQAEL